MASSTSFQQDCIVPVARSMTPGPLFFRSPQAHKISLGRISRRRRSTSLSLRDFNHAAIFEQAVRQHQSIPQTSLLAPATTFSSFETAPSLISSASSTPSTVAFDVFPCSEAGTLPTTLPTLQSESPLLGFETHMEFAVPPQYSSIGYPSSYQTAYLTSLLVDEKASMADDSDHQSSYGGGYAADNAVEGSSPAMGSRCTSVDAESLNDNYSSYSQSFSYPTSSSIGHATAPAYSYTGYPYDYTGPNEPRTHPSYEGITYQYSNQGYVSATSAYTSQHRHPRYSHSISVDPSMTHGPRPSPAEPPKELRCYDHGCNGRVFSTHSNLLRHQREKSGNSSKSECPKCGAQFTRKTAMRGHMVNGKCGKKSTYNTPQSCSASQSDM